MTFSVIVTLLLGAAMAAFVTSFIRLTSGIVGADRRYICRNPFKYERFIRDLCVNLSFASVSTAVIGTASTGHFFDFDSPPLIIFLGIIGALLAAWALEEGTEPIDESAHRRIKIVVVFVIAIFLYAAGTAVYRSSSEKPASEPSQNVAGKAPPVAGSQKDTTG